MDSDRLVDRKDPPFESWQNGVVEPGSKDLALGLVRSFGQQYAEFEGRILPVDQAVAVQSATFHVPDPAPYRDAFIGATALIHGMTVVTRNALDFERFPNTEVLNPWA